MNIHFFVLNNLVCPKKHLYTFSRVTEWKKFYNSETELYYNNENVEILFPRFILREFCRNSVHYINIHNIIHSIFYYFVLI